MANLLDRFNKDVLGSRDKLIDYLPLIDGSGDFKKIRNIEVVLSNWNNILMIPKRTYIFDPDIGSDLLSYVFEPADDETKEAIKREVKYALTSYDNQATVEAINIYYLPSGKKGFIVDVLIEYKGERNNMQAVIDENLYFNFFSN